MAQNETLKAYETMYSDALTLKKCFEQIDQLLCGSIRQCVAAAETEGVEWVIDQIVPATVNTVLYLRQYFYASTLQAVFDGVYLGAERIGRVIGEEHDVQQVKCQLDNADNPASLAAPTSRKRLNDLAEAAGICVQLAGFLDEAKNRLNTGTTKLCDAFVKCQADMEQSTLPNLRAALEALWTEMTMAENNVRNTAETLRELSKLLLGSANKTQKVRRK